MNEGVDQYELSTEFTSMDGLTKEQQEEVRMKIALYGCGGYVLSVFLVILVFAMLFA